MKLLLEIILIGICAHVFAVARADARGEIPPPPPFQGGSAGDWLGSGPVFGFEPSVSDPWTGIGGKGGGDLGSGGGNGYGGSGGSSGGGSGGGRRKGAWGGSWWTMDGPLGGGGWGGWGGWGSGLGPGSGGGMVDTDTNSTGHIWREDTPFLFTSCYRETWVGPGHNGCACIIQYDPLNSGSEDMMIGVCEPNEIPIDMSGTCGFVGVLCRGSTP